MPAEIVDETVMAPVAEFMDTPETGVPIVNTFVPVPPVLVGAADVIS